MDFLQGFFDIQTLRLISGSGPHIGVPHEGTPVFVSGRKIHLFNAYDAFEMALRDELLSTIPDPVVVEVICDLMMNDFVRAQDAATDAADVAKWFAATSIASACMAEMVLPLKVIGRLSLRMQSCLKRLCRMMESEEFITS